MKYVYKIEVLDIAWMAGLLEGEGSFMNGYRSQPTQAAISVEMKDEDIIKRISELWKVKYCACTPRKLYHSITYKAHLRGKRAKEIMELVQPFMGIRRKEKIKEILGK